MFVFMFIVLLTSTVNDCNHRKCTSLNDLQCMIRPILSNLHPNKHSQRLYYYSFVVKLGRCVGRCNNLNDLS